MGDPRQGIVYGMDGSDQGIVYAMFGPGQGICHCIGDLGKDI